MSNRHQELTSPEANGFCKELVSPKQTALGSIDSRNCPTSSRHGDSEPYYRENSAGTNVFTRLGERERNVFTRLGNNEQEVFLRLEFKDLPRHEQACTRRHASAQRASKDPDWRSKRSPQDFPNCSLSRTMGHADMVDTLSMLWPLSPWNSQNLFVFWFYAGSDIGGGALNFTDTLVHSCVPFTCMLLALKRSMNASVDSPSLFYVRGVEHMAPCRHGPSFYLGCNLENLEVIFWISCSIICLDITWHAYPFGEFKVTNP
uniref:Uncharacterized protein n=1 Tax=Tanacetum cinerariifolium TaxID=118510 RepID=A0A699IX05_TANCI|nr:hypothetical protein [Tanacetum cinerariifolium]